MQSQIKLGRIFGIRIGIHYSWFLIAFLIVVSLTAQFRASHPEWGEPATLSLALVTGLLFFVSLLLHELAHSVFAKGHGVPVREITLFALGGVSQIETNPTSAQMEFWMAFVGPLTSAVIGVACLLIRHLVGIASSPVFAMFSWLGYINLGLAGFNMIPGYPLDGGRVLRSILWWFSDDLERSTRQAARAGQVIGGVFIAGGIVEVFAGAGFSGLWLVFIGWFLLQAAGESSLQAGLARILQGVTVADVMTTSSPSVDGHLTVQSFVEENLLRTGSRCFMVEDNGRTAGLITAQEVKALDRDRWPSMTLLDIMRPIDELHTVKPQTPLKAALEMMGRENVNQLPVMQDHQVEGVLTRARLVGFLHNRLELQH